MWTPRDCRAYTVLKPVMEKSLKRKVLQHSDTWKTALIKRQAWPEVSCAVQTNAKG